MTVFFAKSAVVSTIERLLARDMKMARLICYIFQALVAVGGLASLLAITIKCAAEDLLTQNRNNTCPDQVSKDNMLYMSERLLTISRQRAGL